MTLIRLSALALMMTYSTLAFALDRSGLVDDAAATNTALLVGAPNGLPGIDHDLDNAEMMATDPAYHYKTNRLFDGEATKSALLKNLTSGTKEAGAKGSFMFYFSGHGNQGIIAATNFQIVKIAEIKKAMGDGRKGLGPLGRLVLLFDSCNSGSLLDPVRNLFKMNLAPTTGDEFVDSVVNEFTATNARDAYWTKLFVFASSKASETSAGDDEGGFFTLGMKKAYGDLSSTSTVNDFIAATKKATQGPQHPVARLVPASLGQETMKPRP